MFCSALFLVFYALHCYSLDIIFVSSPSIKSQLYISLLQRIAERVQIDSLQEVNYKILNMSELAHITSYSSRTVLIAHSQSGIDLQKYVYNENVKGTLHENIIALVLVSCHLQRIYNGTDFPLETMIVSGGRDGLTRITRIAECFHKHLLADRENANENFMNYPVLIVSQANHTSFLNGTSIAGDLTSTMTQSDAVSTFATFIADYIIVQMTKDQPFSPAARRHRQRQLMNAQIIDNYLTALTLERSYNLKPPCNEQTVSDACWEGCLWTEVVQKWLLPITVAHDRFGYYGVSFRNATHTQTYSRNMYKTTLDLWSTYMHSAEYIEMSLVTRTLNCRHIAQFTVNSMLDRLNVSDGGRVVVEEGRRGDAVTKIINGTLYVRAITRRLSDKIKCKIISPARVVEWILVDSLR